jgi:glycosyltransferase involved in cell wall biosynthesis
MLYIYRARAIKRALRRVDAFVMGSRFIRQSYLDLGYLWPDAPIHIIPYGVEMPASSAGPTPLARPPRVAGAPLRFGMIGSILPHKGVHLAVAAFAGIDPAHATLTVWGDPAIDAAYTGELAAMRGPGTELRGRFADEEKPAVFATMDVLLLPSLGLESFGLVAREAMLHGVPVLASDRGALSDLLADGEGGALFDPDDPAALRGWVERLIADPATLDRWSERLPLIKSADAHAEEIEEVYDRIVAQRAVLDRTLAGARRSGRHRRRTA